MFAPMKRYIAGFVAVISCLALSSQTPGTAVLTGNVEQNILFAGIKNPVIVQLPGVRDSDIRLRSNDAYVLNENGTWYVSPKDNGKDRIEIEVLRKNGSTYVPVGGKLFYVQRDSPKQMAYIVTQTRTYHSGERIPLTELLDDSTRVQVLFDEWIDYPESDLELSKFTVRYQLTKMHCTGDTLPHAFKDSIQAVFDRGVKQLPIQISPMLGKKTSHSSESKVLKNSIFFISQ